MKKIISLLFVSILFFATVAEAKEITLEINQKDYTKAAAPTFIEGRVYVPLRVISEALENEVKWNGKSMSVLINSNHAPDLDRGEIKIYVNNKKLALSNDLGRPYLSLEGVTYVPLRVVGEALGAEIEWLSTEKKVMVTKKKADLITIKPKKELVASSTIPIVASPQTPKIFSQSNVTLESINRYLEKKEKDFQTLATKKGSRFIPFPKEIGRYYYEIGKKYGISGEYALAQAILETGHFQYGNEVKPEQNNFCGLGAIGRVNTKEDLEKLVFSKVDKENAYLVVNNHGWNFKTVAIGVEAHIQHLYSYASKERLPEVFTLYDGRFNHGNRGKALYWHDLNGKWAVPGKGYGERIDKIAKEIQMS